MLNAAASRGHQGPLGRGAHRSIHLVDVENLAGTSLVSEAEVAALREVYLAVAEVRATDHVVLASGSAAAPAVWFGWGAARRILRSGLNGADLALIELVDRESLAVRYSRVVVASGDGIFAAPCLRLRRDGAHVTVVTRPEALSTALKLAASDVRFLTPTWGNPAAVSARAA